ncbi:Hint domain-containing protein [Streptomyces sp. NPDC006207]
MHPEALVLCADLTWKMAGELKTGDKLVSFDEETVRVGNANGGRRYRKGIVIQNERGTIDSYRVVTDDGESIASAEHLWLVRLPYVNRGSRIAWVASKDLSPNKHRIINIGRPWVPENTRIAGWMAGVLDADGHAFAGGRHGSWVGFGQVDGPVLDLFLSECGRRGWAIKVIRRDWTKRSSISENPKDFTDIRINGGMWASCRVLGTLRPERLLPIAAQMWEGAVVGKTTGDSGVLYTEHLGEQHTVWLATNTRTFIAEGSLCRSSQDTTTTEAV